MAAVILPVTPARAQSDGQVIVDRLRTRLKSATALKAEFTQSFSSEFFDDTESTTGVVILQGSKYRVETPSQVFVSDGMTT